MSRGAVSCWGRNDYGQTGNLTQTFLTSTAADVADPIVVPALSSGILSIGAGGYHTCAVVQGTSPSLGASAVCWGKNDKGQLGVAATSPVYSTSAMAVFGLQSGVASLAAGFEHTCARMVNGSVLCWGSNVEGQLGQGYMSPMVTAPALVSGVPSRVAHIAAGGYHTCALLDDGAVFCWGKCVDTQIGDNSPACSTAVLGQPFASSVHGLGAGSGVVKISAGNLHSCAVMSNGSAVCWGSNVFGQLGDNTQLNKPVPGFVQGVTDAVAITCGFCHSCLLRSNGQAMCWGCNTGGQLATGFSSAGSFSTTHACIRKLPQNVCLTTSPSPCTSTSTSCSSTTCTCSTISSGIAAIVAGREHTCMRHIDGTLFCFGINFDKELSSACPSTFCRLPVRVSGLTTQALEVWDQPALSSVFSVSFNISDADRAPAKANATITFAFTPQTAVISGGSVTINFPAAFFAPDVTPHSTACNIPDLLFTAGSTSMSSLVLTTSDSFPTTPVVITVHGLTLGAATMGDVGVTVQTSSDVAVSIAVASGYISGRVTDVAFRIATADRIAGNNNATITLAFTPYSAIQDQQHVTLHYPHAFFAPDILPFAVASNSNIEPGSFAFSPTSNTSLVFTLTAASLPASAVFIVTIGGVTLGAATDGLSDGITLQSTSDTGKSVPVHSGPIFISLVPVAVTASPKSPFVGDSVTVHGHSFILPDTPFVCTAKIGPNPSSGVSSSCALLSSSIALVTIPHTVIIAPSFVQLHFEPGNFTSTAATRLCPCSRAAGGTVCGCAADSCAART